MKVLKDISDWLMDYFYMVLFAFNSVIYIKPPKHYLGHVVDGKVPVLIIPGILGKWSFLKKLADTISLLGHPVYVVPDLGYNLYNIPKSSDIVHSVIKKEDLRNAIILAHSKGGLIGKYTLIHHNEDKRIIGMVSLATPYHGSAITKLLPVEPISELHNDSLIIKDLNSHTAVNKEIVSICPVFDNHVWAKEGSRLEGAKNINVNVFGHHKIVYDKEVVGIVKREIERISLGVR